MRWQVHIIAILNAKKQANAESAADLTPQAQKAPAPLQQRLDPADKPAHLARPAAPGPPPATDPIHNQALTKADLEQGCILGPVNLGDLAIGARALPGADCQLRLPGGESCAVQVRLRTGCRAGLGLF
jgi:hypothetical protein